MSEKVKKGVIKKEKRFFDKGKVFDFLQKLGKVLMVVIAVMPAAGIMISIGKLLPMLGNDVMWLTRVGSIIENIGWAVITNLNILFAVAIALILSIIEYLGGMLIETIFGEVFWDYSDHKFNFGKYASLEMSLIWALASIIYIYVIHPIINRYIYLIPKILLYILTLLFIIDILIF